MAYIQRIIIIDAVNMFITIKSSTGKCALRLFPRTIYPIPPMDEMRPKQSPHTESHPCAGASSFPAASFAAKIPPEKKNRSEFVC